jgi:hypothetical protein
VGQFLVKSHDVTPELLFILRLYARTRRITMARLVVDCIKESFKSRLVREGSPLAHYLDSDHLPPRKVLLREQHEIYDELYRGLQEQKKLTFELKSVTIEPLEKKEEE